MRLYYLLFLLALIFGDLAVRLDQTGEIEQRLTNYLGAPLERFAKLADGWESAIFEFTLGSRSARLSNIEPDAALILRVYGSSANAAKGKREFAVMRMLESLGYAAPRAFLFEGDQEPLGAPFIVMERLAGRPLFSPVSFPGALRTFSTGFVSFVRAQARLHRLDVAPATRALAGLAPPSLADGLPCEAPLLERMLLLIRTRIERGPLPGLERALASVAARAGEFADAPPSLLHLDYHPRNVLVRGLRVTGVIDWVNLELGDRHLDAAMTSVIMATSALEKPRWMGDNAAGNSLRRLFTALYVPLYHAMAPLEWRRFRYCQAVAGLFRLSTLATMRLHGAGAAGYRPVAMGEVTPSVLRLLSRYVADKTGNPVSVEAA